MMWSLIGAVDSVSTDELWYFAPFSSPLMAWARVPSLCAYMCRDFVPRFLKASAALPDDWDVLVLNWCVDNMIVAA